MCTRPVLAAKQSGDLFSLQPHEICSAVLSLGVRSDSRFSGLWCVCMIALMRERLDGSNSPSLIRDVMPLTAGPALSAITPASKLIEGL